ncbi:MAG: PLP-dependent aminotransferase family protein [Proteobacteria bacterium]|nr:PLP-dependent aminotransferase family protein [Pseudomonadota bacterium]
MTLPRARRMDLVQPNAVGELLRMGADPAITSFAGGYPDATLFPLEQLHAVYDTAVREQGQSAMQYTVSDGSPKLRAQIAARMARHGVTCTADDVLMLQGSQQGLDLVAKLMIDPGDVVITESPTFVGVLIAFNPMQPRYAGVRLGPGGMDMDHLEEVLKKNPGAKLLYTIPDFQNPTGATMELAARKRLIALANKHNLVVVEDTAYREVRFAGEAPPMIKSLDTEGRVILLGSFSKILAPGLRLGWAIAAPELIQQLGLLKLAADTQCSTVNMAAASLFLERFDLDDHIGVLRQAYRRKKDLMLDTMRQHFPQEVRFTDPDGGLFTWATLPSSFNTEDFMRRRALSEAKVAYVPGASFFPDKLEHNHMRLNYSGQPDAKIVAGMTALGKLLKDELARKG